MRKAYLTIVVLLAAALLVAAPVLTSAEQQEKGATMGPGMGMMHGQGPGMMGSSGMGPGMGMMHGGMGMGPGMGMGMMHGGMGMGPCMEMMMGSGAWGEELSDADRGDILVLQGQMLLKKAEIIKKHAEAVIAKGKDLRKGSAK